MPITEDRPDVVVLHETSRWAHPAVFSGGWDLSSLNVADAHAARFAAAAEGFRRAGLSPLDVAQLATASRG